MNGRKGFSETGPVSALPWPSHSHHCFSFFRSCQHLLFNIRSLWKANFIKSTGRQTHAPHSSDLRTDSFTEEHRNTGPMKPFRFKHSFQVNVISGAVHWALEDSDRSKVKPGSNNKESYLMSGLEQRHRAAPQTAVHCESLFYQAPRRWENPLLWCVCRGTDWFISCSDSLNSTHSWTLLEMGPFSY